ncbi:MAG: / family protein [Planctomycetaceae bacterium]|nr:/ family protein [Planctomycetaceae bacterium]
MSDTRRFYFDDGKSRKRWHVQVTGKSQIVHYGRLGGSLRESKKSFKSPAEATEQTDKLIAKKRREGYIEINPARLEIVRHKGMRKATEEQIKRLEEKIGCGLPEEYRNFLKTCNGGYPNPDCVQVPGMEGIEAVGVGVLYHLQPSKPVVDELLYEWEHVAKLLPKGHLPIAGSSDIYTLSLHPKTFGSVYWWFHETDKVDDFGNFLKSAGYLLAGSFDEFLTRIALLYGDDEEPVEQQTVSARAANGPPKATIKRLLRLVSHDLTPAKVKEIEQVVQELGDLGGIQDGEWPFTNIRSPRVVRCVLKAGLNPEITDTEGHSLLWQCATHTECIDLILEQGARVDRRSGNGVETALMRAIFLEAIPAVERLMQAGANPALRLQSYVESKLKRNEELRKLIEQAREEWRKNPEQQNQTPPAQVKLKSAATETKQKKPKATLKQFLKLMQHDYIPEGGDEFAAVEGVITELGDLSGIQDGEWPSIGEFEDPRLLRALLEAHLNPEITAKDGNSLLNQCVVNPACIDLLLQRGVDIDRRSGRAGETALMRATYKGDEECVERLLQAGANPTLEFSHLAKVLLEMDDEMTAIIQAAQDKWNRNKGKMQVATAKKNAKRKSAGAAGH